MNELVDKLRAEFQDKEYRHSYADESLNTMIATQIKVLREQREMTQAQLAEATGMKQPRIPLLEDSNYSNWTINTLKRFAKAFDVTLSVKFETFSRFIRDFENLSRESLERVAFADDWRFQHRSNTILHRRGGRRHFRTVRRYRNSKGYPVSRVAWTQMSNTGSLLARKLPRSAHHAAEGAKQQQGAGSIGADLRLIAGGKLA
jgi:transcriptional regulator with XRE-family HTH domain